MQVVAILNLADGKTPDDLAPYARGEAQAAYAMVKEGILRAINLRTDRPGALLTFEVDSVEAAEAAVARLPFVEHGLLTREIIPLAPYTGLDAIISS